jgi:hypothetical protein
VASEGAAHGKGSRTQAVEQYKRNGNITLKPGIVKLHGETKNRGGLNNRPGSLSPKIFAGD